MTNEEKPSYEEMRDEIFTNLCKLSDRQFDDCLKPRLKELMGKPASETNLMVRGIIADCQYASLCSSFEIRVLKFLLEENGWTKEDEQKFQNTPVAQMKVIYGVQTAP